MMHTWSYVPLLYLQLFASLPAPQAPPSSFQGINSGSTSILLRWDPIPQDLVTGVQNCFYITYRQLDTADNTTYNITVPITSVTVEITNLRKYTNYSFDIKDVTKFIGAATQPIIITTGEDGTSYLFSFLCHPTAMWKIALWFASYFVGVLSSRDYRVRVLDREITRQCGVILTWLRLETGH